MNSGLSDDRLMTNHLSLGTYAIVPDLWACSNDGLVVRVRNQMQLVKPVPLPVPH